MTDDMRLAVVVGMCAHGLTIVRDLYRRGVPVLALETNCKLPGVATRYAEIEFVREINGDGVVDSLLKVAQARQFSEKPILFLTSDRMVESVGKASEAVAQYYVLSWLPTAVNIVPLLSKANIECRCAEAGFNYPRSAMVFNVADFLGNTEGFEYPLIVKPSRPLSSFKTLVLESPASLSLVERQIADCLPVIVQEFIPGDDSRIVFGALLLDQGRLVARFEGRKLRSRPMGHTTVAISEPSDEVHALAMRFFEGKALSGPVSLELKRDEEGRCWVIEPTVGRTDFWVGICSANGVNLPWIEYQKMTEGGVSNHDQTVSTVWVNGERDPGALLWVLLNYPTYLFCFSFRGVYFDTADFRPWWASFTGKVSALPSRVVRKLAKSLGLVPGR
jgi:D-aspartate ligase